MNLTEQTNISPDFVTDDEPSAITPKPQPKPRRLKPVTDTDNEQIKCLTSPDSTGSAAGSMHRVSISQNASEKHLPVSHSPPALEQLSMHSEHSTDIAGNFQHNTQ